MFEDAANTILLPHTPVKRQGKTASCWAFSVLSYLETECPGQEYAVWHLVRGKYLDLIRQADRSPLRRMPSGALGHTAVSLLLQNGVLPLEEYPGRVPAVKAFRLFSKVAFMLHRTARLCPATRTLSSCLLNRAMDLLWGKLPSHSSSVLQTPVREKLEHLVELTSFAHLPYEEWHVLNLPDNYEQKPFYNLPLETLMNLLEDLLHHGHSFVWDGCLHGGYNMQTGTAILPQGTPVSESLRSQQFLQGTLTDDHMMHIIGLTRIDGQPYFIAKNSVGQAGPYQGLLCMHADFLRMKTISVLVDSRDIQHPIRQNCQ